MTVGKLIYKLSSMPLEKQVYIQTGGEPNYFKAYSVKETELVEFDTNSDQQIDVVVIDYE